MNRQPMDKQKAILDIPYAIFLDVGNLTNDQRRAALERVCLTLLRAAHKCVLVEFFTDHIKEIASNIDAKDKRVRICFYFLSS